MKKAARSSFYALISIVTVLTLVALMVLTRHLEIQLSQTYAGSQLLYVVKTLTPIVVSALFFIKIYMQRSVPAKFSFAVNALSLILLVGGIVAFHIMFHHVPNILLFVITNPLAMFAMGLQTFSLLCDLVSKKRGAPGDALPTPHTHPPTVPPAPAPAPAPLPAAEPTPEETPTSL